MSRPLSAAAATVDQQPSTEIPFGLSVSIWGYHLWGRTIGDFLDIGALTAERQEEMGSAHVWDNPRWADGLITNVPVRSYGGLYYVVLTEAGLV